MVRPRWARAGHVRRAHGLRGRLALRVYTTAPVQPLEPGTPVLVDGRPHVMTRCRATAPDGLLADLEGVRSREAAEAMAGRPVSFPLHAVLEAGCGLPLPELVGMRLEGPGVSPCDELTVTGFVPVPGNPLVTVGSGPAQMDVPLGLLRDDGVDWDAGTLSVELPEGLREALGG